MKFIELAERLNKIKKESLEGEEEFLKELESKKLELEKKSKDDYNIIIRNAKKKNNLLVETARKEAEKEAAKIKKTTKIKLSKLKFENYRIRKILSMLYKESGL